MIDAERAVWAWDFDPMPFQPKSHFLAGLSDELSDQLLIWDESRCELWEDKEREVPRAPYGKYLKCLNRCETLYLPTSLSLLPKYQRKNTSMRANISIIALP